MRGSTDAVVLPRPEFGAVMRLTRPLVAAVVVLASAGAGYVASLIWPLPTVSGSATQLATTVNTGSIEREPREGAPTPATPVSARAPPVSKTVPQPDMTIPFDLPSPSQPSTLVSLPQKSQTEVRGTSTSS